VEQELLYTSAKELLSRLLQPLSTAQPSQAWLKSSGA